MNISTIGSESECPDSLDNLFGPLVAYCRRAFDFTLLFEEIFLSILPSAIFLLLAPVRIFFLYRKRPRVGGKLLQNLKLVLIFIFGALQIALLVLWCLHDGERTGRTLVSVIFSTLDVIALALLSYGEHAKSIRPSSLVNVFLVFTIIFDAVRARTLWLLGNSFLASHAVFTTSIGVKILMLILEATEKRAYLTGADTEKGPEETGGILNRSFFIWLNNIMVAGFTKALVVDDLHPLHKDLLAKNLQRRFTALWEKESKNQKDYSLLLTLCRSLKWQLLASVPGRTALVAFTCLQPLLLSTFIDYLTKDFSVNRANHGYGMLAAYGIVYTGIAISTGFYWQRVYRSITMIRGILVSTIYRKTMELSITTLDNSQAVSLMSTDVQRIVDGLRNMHELWANLLQTGICTWLLDRQIGVACIAPVVVSVASTIIAGGLAGVAGKRQAMWMEFIERRVGITASMLGSIRGVKMTGLTPTLSELIQKLRVDEIEAGTSFRMVMVYAITLGFTPQLISPVMAFGIFIAKDDRILDSTRLFTSLSLILLITSPLSQLLQSIPLIVGAISCTSRIQKFLVSPSRFDKRILPSEASNSQSLEFNESLKTEKSSLTEKQSLIDFKGRDAVSPSEAGMVVIQDGSFGWKNDGTPVLKNIDIRIHPSSMTMVLGPVASGKSTLLKALLGETLYAEGKVEVSPKRIAFCDQTPWLSNASVRKNIIGYSEFNAVWYEAVVHACVLEPDFLTLPQGDQTVVGSKGIALSGGQKQRLAVARAVYAKMELAIFDDVFSGLDATTQQQLFTRVFGRTGLLHNLGTTVIIATHAVNLLPFADHIICLDKEGSIAEQGSFNELNSRRGYVYSFALEKANDDSISEESSSASPSNKRENTQAHELEVLDDGHGDISIYRYYFKSIGSVTISLFFTFEVAFAFINNFPSIWLAWWAKANGEDPGRRNGHYLGGYAGFQGAGVLIIACTAWLVCNVIIVKSGTKLHRTILDTVLNAPMLFFTTTDVGMTTNRFSQDMQLIDTDLPISLLDLVAGVLICIGQAGLIANSSYWITIAYPPLLGVFYVLQHFYLRTSRQLRLMDLESKSPLYSLFLESLNGLPTLRAFGWQDQSRELNDRLLDRSQRPFYLLYMIQRWLTLILDFVSVGLAVVVVAVAVVLRDSVIPGFTGVALVSIISFMENVKYLIISWTNLETALGAVKRVKDFSSNTESEQLAQERSEPPGDWPQNGNIELQHVSAGYKSGEKDILKNLNISIKAGEKVAVCGRSGSGKSSLILALFRMIEINKGSIIIDGLDISQIARQTVRSRLQAIPQDPYFLNGSIRLNLDPTLTSTDDEIIEALAKVTLWNKVEKLGGLDTPFEEDMLSHGQRQLFCLARYILRSGKIIALDEATSSVDRETDALMQKIIRQEFEGRTILAVVHRLDTILDFDRVIVLDQGVLVECDTPSKLLDQPSAFRRLFEIYSKKGSKLFLEKNVIKDEEDGEAESIMDNEESKLTVEKTAAQEEGGDLVEVEKLARAN